MADRLHLQACDCVLAVETDRGILFTPYDPDVEAGLAVARPQQKHHHEPDSDFATLAAGSLTETALAKWLRDRRARFKL